jgi:hypothetical protein
MTSISGVRQPSSLRGAVNKNLVLAARAPAAAAYLPGPRIRGGERRAGADVNRVRAVLLLRQRVRPGVTRQELVQCRGVSPVLLNRLRHRGPGRRRILDRRGAHPAVIWGSAIAAVTARSPVSPRRRATSAPASASRCWARSHQVQLRFAHSAQTVFYGMAAVMAATCVVALWGLPRGRVDAPEEAASPSSATPTT